MHSPLFLVKHFEVKRSDLAYLQFIIESYEGIASLSTVDRRNGIVAVNYPDCFAEDVNALMTALAGEISLRPLPCDEPSIFS